MIALCTIVLMSNSAALNFAHWYDGKDCWSAFPQEPPGAVVTINYPCRSQYVWGLND